MTDLKNNLEKVWNDEYKDFMLSFYPESSPLVSTWEIYRMAKIKSQKEINRLEQELQKSQHEVEFLKSGLSEDTLKTLKTYPTALPYICEIKQELQKTRDQLAKCELALNNYAICDDIGTAARRYFQDKDKQGEG